jgi:hypothetical protein
MVPVGDEIQATGLVHRDRGRGAIAERVTQRVEPTLEFPPPSAEESIKVDRVVD